MRSGTKEGGYTCATVLSKGLERPLVSDIAKARPYPAIPRLRSLRSSILYLWTFRAPTGQVRSELHLFSSSKLDTCFFQALWSIHPCSDRTTWYRHYGIPRQKGPTREEHYAYDLDK